MRISLEEVEPTRVEILEGEAPSDGRMRVRAVLQIADQRNKNGRVYPKAILEREVNKMQAKISAREAYGAGDHPSDGRTRISDVSSIWERVWMDDKGVVMGDAVIVPTSRGKDLMEILRAKGSVNLSARGFGETEPKEWQGAIADIVKEDYDLHAWDFVIGGGFKEAKVQQMREEDAKPPHIEGGGGARMEITTIEQLRAAYPTLVSQLSESIKTTVEKELSEQFDKQVMQKFGDEKKVIEEHVRAQVMEEFQVEALQESLRMMAEIVAPWINVDEKGLISVGAAVVQPTEESLAQAKELQTKLDEAEARAKTAEQKLKVADEKALKDVAALQEKVDADEAQKYLTEVLKTEEHAALIQEQLAGCKTKQAIDEELPKVKARLKQLTDGLKLPTGKGLVEDGKKEDKGTLTEEQNRQRQMAGLPV